MIDRGREWSQLIERIKRIGAGDYGAPHFMCQKDEHWKFLWAAERNEELTAEVERLAKENAELVEALEFIEDCGYRPICNATARDALKKHRGTEWPEPTEVAKLKDALRVRRNCCNCPACRAVIADGGDHATTCRHWATENALEAGQ